MTEAGKRLLDAVDDMKEGRVKWTVTIGETIVRNPELKGVTIHDFPCSATDDSLQKAHADAVYHGTGVLLDGKHVQVKDFYDAPEIEDKP